MGDICGMSWLPISPEQLAALPSDVRAEIEAIVRHYEERIALPEAEHQGLRKTPQSSSLPLGKKLGQKLQKLISIISYQSVPRWGREAEVAHTAKKATPKRKLGRPRTPDDIREPVLKLARENSWGDSCILCELRKLGIKSISLQTVTVILNEHDIESGPKRGRGTWDEFLKIHADTQWQCGFVSKPMWTTRGLVAPYFLGGLHLETRRGGICPKNIEQPVEVSVDIRPRDSAWLGLGGCRGGPSEGLCGRNRSDQNIERSNGSPLAGVESVCAAFRDKVPLVSSVTANCSNDATATS